MCCLAFWQDPKRAREWKKDFEKIKSTKPNRQRLDGAEIKRIDENLEENLVHWIYEKRSKMLHVSRKIIMWKSKYIKNKKTTILPSKNHLLLFVHGVKSLCEGMSSLLEEKLQLLRRIHCIWLIVSMIVSVMHVRRIQKQFNFHDGDIFAMDETSAWNDMVFNTTVEKTGSKEVPMKSTGHDKIRVSLCLTRKVDGTRLKPFIVFKGG